VLRLWMDVDGCECLWGGSPALRLWMDVDGCGEGALRPAHTTPSHLAPLMLRRLCVCCQGPPAYMYTDTHTCVQGCAHRHKHVHLHAHTRTCTHRRIMTTQTYTLTHTHACAPACLRLRPPCAALDTRCSHLTGPPTLSPPQLPPKAPPPLPAAQRPVRWCATTSLAACSGTWRSVAWRWAAAA